MSRRQCWPIIDPDDTDVTEALVQRVNVRLRGDAASMRELSLAELARVTALIQGAAEAAANAWARDKAARISTKRARAQGARA